jgi:hypothetical protein
MVSGGKSMTTQQPPPGWGTDELTKFIDGSLQNCYASFHNKKPEYERLLGIDRVFATLIASCVYGEEWFVAFFLIRAHSCFRAAVQLAIGGQVPESYPLMRSCLENALYGFYLSRNPASRETWLRRHDSDESKKKVKREFQIRRLLEELRKVDASEAKRADKLYERTIDFGGHPNERAVMQSLKMARQEDRIEFQVPYLIGDTKALQLSLRTTAQVGVCVLGIFRLVFEERFDLLGITELLGELREGL